jgi:site-specific recombinase XerD
LRHSFATEAIIRGVDVPTIAKLMGHANTDMLMRIYQHVSKREDHLREGLRRATA